MLLNRVVYLMTLYIFGYFFSLYVTICLCGWIRNWYTQPTCGMNFRTGSLLKGESLYEAWECFKLMLHKCPYHGLQDWLQLQTSYNGINGNLRSSLDGAFAGAFICGNEFIWSIERFTYQAKPTTMNEIGGKDKFQRILERLNNLNINIGHEN
ncbi:Retrotransposon gag protein [Gossypium australe]|uniref:Retrotransposon gag protein n=1 Tax=Gossypium australe TaxID=47621 RepID=A0A5B6U584_9ROSI|nr:Retrotransposon gag protein [Gossypium australe]